MEMKKYANKLISINSIQQDNFYVDLNNMIYVVYKVFLY